MVVKQDELFRMFSITGKSITCPLPLSKMVEIYGFGGLVQVNRSALVNLLHVESIGSPGHYINLTVADHVFDLIDPRLWLELRLSD